MATMATKSIEMTHVNGVTPHSRLSSEPEPSPRPCQVNDNSSRPFGSKSLKGGKTIQKKQNDKQLGELIVACRTGNSNKLAALLITTENDIFNKKNKEGTTPLHEACGYGQVECAKLLLKSGAGATIWDARGFSPAHCAAYNNQIEALKLLLDFNPPANSHRSKCGPDSRSEHDETLLHISCLQGHLSLSQLLLKRLADICSVDKHGNNVIHYAVCSNSEHLLRWLIDQLIQKLGVSAGQSTLNRQNEFGQTAVHRAVILNCPLTAEVLLQQKVDFCITDRSGHTPKQLAHLLGHKTCWKICNRNERPSAPPTSSGALLSKSLDNLSSSQTSSVPHKMAPPPRTIASCSPIPSITGGSRPRTLSIIRRSSIKSRGSISSRQSAEDSSMYISKESALQVQKSINHQKTNSWDSAHQVIYDSTAHEPPPDILFIPPIERFQLSQNAPSFFSKDHDIKIRVLPEYWPRRRPDHSTSTDPDTLSESTSSIPRHLETKSGHRLLDLRDVAGYQPSDPEPLNSNPGYQSLDLKEVDTIPDSDCSNFDLSLDSKTVVQSGMEVCIGAAMHLNQPFPSRYVIVSPIFFVSCKSSRSCEAMISLPHAVTLRNEEDKKRLCILSTTIVDPSLKAESPLLSPSDRSLTRLETAILKSDRDQCLKFRTRLVHPCLFAVAINEMDYPSQVPLPLRCSMYVTYPIMESSSRVSGFYVTSYVGMNLKTVDKAVTDQTTKNKNKFEEIHFILPSQQLFMEAQLTNNPSEWTMSVDNKDGGKFSYTQLALTRDTDNDSYSHLPAYPPHTQFFIEPQGMAAAVKCRVRVLDANKRELTFIRVIPFAPSRDLTPPPSKYRKAPTVPNGSSHLPYSNGPGTTV